MEKKLSCNGFRSNNPVRLNFQGEHSNDTHNYLLNMGYQPDEIVITGISK